MRNILKQNKVPGLLFCSLLTNRKRYHSCILRFFILFEYKVLQTIILLIILGVFLNGCALFAVGAVGAAAGTTALVATDPRSSSVVVNDNTIETKLKFKYSSYESANIYIASYDGVILLTGQVPNKATEQSAIFEAKVTPGVRQIYDYLEIRLPQSFASISQDSLITTQIKTNLLGMKDVSSNNVKVITTNQVVYLFGIVNQAQANTVAKTAASVDNVRKVITLFKYTK